MGICLRRCIVLGLVSALSHATAAGQSPGERRAPALPASPTTNTSQASASVTLEFDRAALERLGWSVSIHEGVDGFATESSLVSPARTDTELTLARTGAGDAQIRGRFRLAGAVMMHTGASRFVLVNPSVVADPGAEAPWRIVQPDSEDGSVTVLDITPTHPVSASEVSASEAVGEAGVKLQLHGALAVSSEWAKSLGMPELAGTIVGRISFAGRIPSTADRPGERLDASHRATTTSAAPAVAGTIGPDVIVGDLPSVNNYGVVDGIAALSVATTSCNIGDEPAAWIDDTNEHPVIAQNMYRLDAGRFEQIGMSWLKHGFFAVSSTLCHSDCQRTDGTALGVHCADPYSASLNGAQNNLGPRFEVNAFTGYFPYPPSNPPYQATIGRRLQVRTTDLDRILNPNASYFIEGHYVTADDAAAGNQNNNASYRPASVSGAGNSVYVQVSGSTRRERPAIRAWADNDPDVVETDVQIPGEGLLLLAAKATDLGDGFWSYEYAVQNLSSDRSAGWFRVPIDDSAVVRNIGFHDVDYHSLEPFSGADWSSVVSAVGITWSTQSYEQNGNANALRWGTLYNFRFEADVAPQSSAARIGLFKPGTSEWVDAATVGPLTNTDDCNNNGVPDSLDIADGTSEDCNANDIPDECESYQPTAELVVSGLDDPVYVTHAPDDPDRLFVVEQPGRIKIIAGGTVNPTPFLDIQAKVSSFGERGLLSMAFHPEYAVNGRFFIDYTDTAGDTVIAEYAVFADPDVADAASEVILKHIEQDFTNHNGGQLHFGPDGYLYAGMGDGGSGNDPLNRAQDTGSLLGKMLRLDVDNPPDYIPPDNPFAATAFPLDEIWAIGLRNPWRFSFDRETGDMYIADVGQADYEEINVQPGDSTGGENYGWRCMEGPMCTGLSGCTCGSPALTLPVHAYPHDGEDCSITGGYVYRGCTLPNLRGTYFFADYCSNDIRSFRYVGGKVTDFQDRTAQLTPSAGSITEIVSFGEDLAGELYIVSRAGSIYRIVPSSATCGNGILEEGETCDDGNTDPGDGCDAVCHLEPENNDDCVNALAVGEETRTFDTTGASTDGPDEPTACNFSGDTQVEADIWYCYEASCTGTGTVDLCSSSYDTKVAVYDGCACPTGDSAIACNDDVCGQKSSISFPVTACGNYLIRVGGHNGATGSGSISISCDPDPVGADCNGNGVDDSVDISCGTSTDGNGNGVPDDCETDGDRIVGGRLFDKWWAEVSATPPAFDHPLWQYRPDPASNTATGGETWRCKECHGWDYKGVDGQYGSGPHRTGFPGVVGASLESAELFSLLREPPSNEGGPGVPNGHDYGSVLPDTRLNDLVAFVLSGVIDTDPYVSPGAGAFLGDPAGGETLYNAGGSPSCINCHGADGTGINFGTFDDPEYVGTVAVENPWEMLHKIRFGPPGAPMPSWLQQGGTNRGAADIGRYAQLTFPTDCVTNGQCDDGIDCTVDTCDAAGRCVFTPSDARCADDGLVCNGSEVCDAGLGCVSTGSPCTGPCSEPDGCVCNAPAVTAIGGRYLAITPQPPDADYAMRLLIAPDCPLGVAKYVGAPEDPLNIAEPLEDQTAAAVRTPSEWGGTVYVTGLDVVPNQRYEIQADCGLDGAPRFSPVVAATTPPWGDTVGTMEGGIADPPDGNTDFRDIGATVAAFKHLPTAPPLYTADLFGCVPNRRVDFIDIMAAVEGFKSRPYAIYSRCAGPCW